MGGEGREGAGRLRRGEAEGRAGRGGEEGSRAGGKELGPPGLPPPAGPRASAPDPAPHARPGPRAVREDQVPPTHRPSGSAPVSADCHCRSRPALPCPPPPAQAYVTACARPPLSTPLDVVRALHPPARAPPTPAPKRARACAVLGRTGRGRRGGARATPASRGWLLVGEEELPRPAVASPGHGCTGDRRCVYRGRFLTHWVSRSGIIPGERE